MILRHIVRITKFRSYRLGLLSQRCLTVNPLVSESLRIPRREDSIDILKSGKEFDILIIGGGSAGAGAALDAASRGLNVACVEREDFGSGTSSRSTQLFWGGSRYLVQAFVALFNQDLRLIRKPRETITKFISEFKMVMNCHRERKFLLLHQYHLTQWIPIAVPLTKWFLWPPPFSYPPAALGPLGLFPLFFKFYDALGSFKSPPSHIMTPKRTERKFPQMIKSTLKYCSVFYEGQHNDARTNLSIALTAAMHGAVMGNYCNVISLTHDANGKVSGAVIHDEISGDKFTVKAKGILFCGGAFTESLRHLEDPACPPAVTGASGIHVVLPAYFAPSNFGLVDMSTSDGRFLFFLPWLGHVLVGTTDHKAEPTMRPKPTESEILWVLHEASKYINPELQLRRQDVLSAWCGIRPLAMDPHSPAASTTSTASRDHIVSHNPKTNVVFLAGGKWTTYREM
jgi:glycerol-3-phosphate dehydrogenase